MAEGLLRAHAGDRFEVYSAGLEPKGVHPHAKKVMEEVGIDISNQHSKDLNQFLGKVHFGYLITVCGNAEERCPVFPGAGTRLFWPFEDPAAHAGPEEERIEKFRQVRDQIDERIKSWLERGLSEAS